jgi:hypothetical protein
MKPSGADLEKDQWHISNDPLELEWEEVKVKIDLAAERLIAAERGEEKIAVEIKSFISPSPISDFHTALGQFLNYIIMLEVKDPTRQLYLAIMGILKEDIVLGLHPAYKRPHTGYGVA